VIDLSYAFANTARFHNSLCDWSPDLEGRGVAVDGMFGSSDCPVSEPTESSGIPVTPLCFICAGISSSELRAALAVYMDNKPLPYHYGEVIGQWIVSLVKEFSSLFASQRMFNEDISTWDVSSATTMWGMFQGATSFNGNLSNWDTSNVHDMGQMFASGHSFNGDLSTWDTSSVQSMNRMFSDAISFDCDLSEWDTANVVNMGFMFSDAIAFDGDLSGWETSKVTNMGACSNLPLPSLGRVWPAGKCRE
jgi:surface protein